MILTNKNILFITPKFFSYEKSIFAEFKRRLANVNIIYDNISEFSLLFKIILKIFKKQKKIYQYYYAYKLKKIKNKIDVLFVIKGQYLPIEIIRLIKMYNPRCICIMYQWDSVKNSQRSLLIKDEFDYVFSFDMVDCKKYGWIYRPLFYRKKGSINYETRKFDISYICSLHSNRYDIYKQLLDLKKKGLNVYFHMYSNFIEYIVNKYLKKEPLFERVKFRDIKFTKLNEVELNDIYMNSRIVVDYAHPSQNGFTIRTIECLGCNCKLLTNNRNVLQSDFYSDNNIKLYSNNVIIDEKFFLQSYKPISHKIIEYYSIESWMNSIFSQIN